MSLRDWFLAPPPVEADAASRGAANAQRRTPGARPAADADRPEPAPRRGTAAEWAPPIHARDHASAPRDHATPRRARLRGASDRGSPGDSLAIVTVAVLGQAGEAEPVAAAVALELRRIGRARAAAVVVIGGDAPSRGGGEGGAPAARRLATRLAAQGLDATARGRLAWANAPLDVADPPPAAGTPTVAAP